MGSSIFGTGILAVCMSAKLNISRLIICLISTIILNMVLWQLRMGLGLVFPTSWLAPPIHRHIYIGPILMTVGPWKPITFEAYTNRIVDVDIRARVNEDLSVNLSADVTFAEKKSGFMVFSLSGPDGAATASISPTATDSGQARVSLAFPPGKLSLWYPIGYGNQSLYTASIKFTDEVWSQFKC